MKYAKKPLIRLFQTQRTVFSFQDIALIWMETNKKKVADAITYYAHVGLLFPLRRGIYAKSRTYDHLELATKVLVPSYVSFETVLVQAGIVFQRYDRVFVATYVSRDVVIDGHTYAFRRIKDDILANPAGIINDGRTSVASPERAFLDTVYTHKGYHFDNLRPLDWKKVEELAPIYGNKRLLHSLQHYRTQYGIQRGES